PAGRGGGLGVVHGDGEAAQVARDVVGRVAHGDPPLEPRGRDAYEGGAALVVPAFGDGGHDTDERAAGRRLEADLDLHVVDGAVPRQQARRLPRGDAAQLEGVARGVVVHLEQPPADAG